MAEQQHTAFMQVGDFVANFGGNELEHTDDLAGRSMDISFDNGWVVRHSFKPGGQMEWQMLQGSDPHPAAPNKDLESYRATCLRQGYYLVDFIKHSKPTQTVSLLLDMVQNIATAVVATMPTREETFKPLFQRVIDRELLTPMRAVIVHGAIDRPFSEHVPRHESTGELVGKRIRYQYGPNDSYEHIYLSREFYTWHCIQGPEAGLSDTDYCQYYKVADKLYLFVWLEKVIPTIGLIMIDFQRDKTSGKIFGYQAADFCATCNTPVGAYLTLKNETRYDDAGS
ncbi:MAG: MoaF C-terminal domain-containing protein [Nitrosomonas halophila]